MIDVLCIGYACYDLIYYPDMEIKHNQKHFVRITDESGGGPAANAAFLLSKWGINTALACMLGKDNEGKAVLEEFRSVQTETKLVIQSEKYTTPFSSILIHPETGERTIFTRHMDSPQYSPPWEKLPGISPKVIVTDGYQLEAALQAKERFPDAYLVLDAGSLRDETRTLLPQTDAAICSEPFGTAISNLSSLDTPEQLHKALSTIQETCPGNIAITRGDRGVIFLAENKVQSIPAFPVAALDTTAAGDIFHGTYVYAYLQGMDFYNALLFAAAASALSVTRRGGRNSIPELSDVQAFFNK